MLIGQPGGDVGNRQVDPRVRKQLTSRLQYLSIVETGELFNCPTLKIIIYKMGIIKPLRGLN